MSESTEILEPYDECENLEGKMSLWKCFKTFWNPKNWFDLRSKVTRKRFWYTFLANIVYFVPIYIIFSIISVFFAIQNALNIFNIIDSLLVFSAVNLIAWSSLIVKRANCAGINLNLIFLLYILPSIITLLTTFYTLKNPGSTISIIASFVNYITIGIFLYVGLKENKYIECRKVINGKAETLEDKEMEFFNKK